MKIKEDNRLYHDDDNPYPFVESPNSDKGVQPLYLIMHYTAGSSAQSAIDWLANPQKDDPTRRVSAHLVISRTGEITQLVPFDRIAWHTGWSYWEGRSSINRFSIGIELDNDGVLKKAANGWVSEFGGVINDDQVLVATHWKNVTENGWVKFPEAQIQAALEVARCLNQQYHFLDILGHEDINDQKVDPGPAFPMQSFRQQVLGRPDPVIEKHTIKTQTKVYENVAGRAKAPRLPPRLPGGQIPAGTPVKVLKEIRSVLKQEIATPGKEPKKGEGKKVPDNQISKVVDNWLLVRVLSPISGVGNVQGLVKKDDVLNNATAAQVVIYKDTGVDPDPEPPIHAVKSLPPGTEVRILEKQPPWVLVGTMAPLPRFKYLQGWVYQDDIGDAM